jgi:hypothetical protein
MCSHILSCRYHQSLVRLHCSHDHKTLIREKVIKAVARKHGHYNQKSEMSPLVLIAFLALAGSHALVLAQIQKCSAICTPKDGRWSYNNNDSRNTLLKIDFTADNIMECTYGLVTPTYKCRYNVVSLCVSFLWCYVLWKLRTTTL